MDLSQLHFSNPWWLGLGTIIPLFWILFFLFFRIDRSSHQLTQFIDSHLLPFLSLNQTEKKHTLWKTLLLWSAVWTGLTLALAGPRWSFREMETFSRDQSLVILLDLSESMNATDSKPSRLVRAKQKIEDLLNLSKGVKIGLIAFAADPHMITPITEDKETIRHLLPSLDTDLVYVQGSKLSSALDMASTMLEAEPGHNKALLIISDGGFEDVSAMVTAKKLAGKGVAIHTMGVGTPEGAPLQDRDGNIIRKNGQIILSKLEKERLREISKMGHGRYLEAHYSDHDEALILKELKKRADAQMEFKKKNRLWDERFYLFILPTLPLILWWFGKGAIFTAIVILCMPAISLEAGALSGYFKNSEERAKQSFDDGNYEAAIHGFKDPYRKGIANYRAGNFTEAEKMFRQSTRQEVASQAAYNLGNSLVQQQKLKEAIGVYEDLLEEWPDHIKAQENLELVRKMIEQQEQKASGENSEQPNHQESEKDGSESQDSNAEQEDLDSNNTDEQNPEDQSFNEQQEEPSDEDAGSEQQEENQDSTQDQQKDHEVEEPDTQEDQDADLWLNRIKNDPSKFLKNKFFIESKKNGTKEGMDPW